MWTPEEVVSGCITCKFAVSGRIPPGNLDARLQMIECSQSVKPGNGPCLFYVRDREIPEVAIRKVPAPLGCNRCALPAEYASWTDEGLQELCSKCFLIYGAGVGSNKGYILEVQDESR